MGRADIELNEEGIAQCAILAREIDPDFEIIYSSPLKRAYTTAQVIAKSTGKEIIICNELSERDFGSLSGKTWDEINTETGKDLKQITKEQRYDFRPYGGESVEQVKERIEQFLNRVRTDGYSKVLIVCHSGIISLMRHMHEKEQLPSIPNASVHEFVLEQ